MRLFLVLTFLCLTMMAFCQKECAHDWTLHCFLTYPAQYEWECTKCHRWKTDTARNNAERRVFEARMNALPVYIPEKNIKGMVQVLDSLKAENMPAKLDKPLPVPYDSAYVWVACPSDTTERFYEKGQGVLYVYELKYVKNKQDECVAARTFYVVLPSGKRVFISRDVWEQVTGKKVVKVENK